MTFRSAARKLSAALSDCLFSKLLFTYRRHNRPLCGGFADTKMNCQELAAKLEELQPSASPTEIARLCLLILNATSDLSCLENDETLRVACRAANFRLEASADQHAAMSAELEGLCQDGPVRFSPDQIWTLLRAVKVQSQLLELYTETPALI